MRCSLYAGTRPHTHRARSAEVSETADESEEDCEEDRNDEDYIPEEPPEPSADSEDGVSSDCDEEEGAPEEEEADPEPESPVGEDKDCENEEEEESSTLGVVYLGDQADLSVPQTSQPRSLRKRSRSRSTSPGKTTSPSAGTRKAKSAVVTILTKRNWSLCLKAAQRKSLMALRKHLRVRTYPRRATAAATVQRTRTCP